MEFVSETFSESASAAATDRSPEDQDLLERSTKKKRGREHSKPSPRTPQEVQMQDTPKVAEAMTLDSSHWRTPAETPAVTPHTAWGRKENQFLEEECGKEVQDEVFGGNRHSGNNPIAGSTSSAPHSGSEKYGSWMLVSRKDRRNRFRGTNQQAYGPPIDRRQGTPTGLASDFEGLGTQSRFATLESLDEANLELGEENMPRNDALLHPEEALPRIRTKAKDVQRSPALGNSGSHRKSRGVESG
nr:uncharacterized protein LOC109171840 [Ipomoea batatas]